MLFLKIILWTIAKIFQYCMCEDNFNPTTHPSWSLLEHERCGLSQADRIIGGKNASLGAYPWIARIGYISRGTSLPSYRCGGAVISKKFILTAAHCVTDLPQMLIADTIRLGEHNVLTNPDCNENEVCADPVQDFKISQIFVYKGYDNPPHKHDIALIKVDREIHFTDWVMPICMIYGSLVKKRYTGVTAEVAGWGFYDIEDPKLSLILQTIKLRVVSMQTCIDEYKSLADLGPKQMCVGGTVGEDSCSGDSGGPLMYVDQIDGTPKYYLIGVVSLETQNAVLLPCLEYILACRHT